MKRINLYEAKTHLSKLVAEVEDTGTTYVLCRNGRPVADLIPHSKEASLLDPDPELAGAKFTGDPCQGLDEADWPESLK